LLGKKKGDLEPGWGIRSSRTEAAKARKRGKQEGDQNEAERKWRGFNRKGGRQERGIRALSKGYAWTRSHSGEGGKTNSGNACRGARLAALPWNF